MGAKSLATRPRSASVASGRYILRAGPGRGRASGPRASGRWTRGGWLADCVYVLVPADDLAGVGYPGAAGGRLGPQGLALVAPLPLHVALRRIGTVGYDPCHWSQPERFWSTTVARGTGHLLSAIRAPEAALACFLGQLSGGPA